MSFEDLRKRARQLESEIDVKLVSFSKIAASYGSNSASSSNSESVALLSGDQMYETISVELEQLLSALSDINEKMNSCSHGSSVATIHTLQRHRDILQDYTHEFQRTNNAIISRKEREQLLGVGRGGNNNNKSLAGLSRRDLYLKESEHLVNSEGMVDEQITIAMETRDHLKSQREAFKMIQTKVNDLSNRFPIINSLMTKINIRKRRDSLILAMPRKLTAEQISEAKECFAIYGNKGGIPIRDLGTALRSLGINPTNSEIKDLVADIGSPPSINFDTFMLLLSKDFTGESPEEIREAFGVFDKDGNGTIAASELKHVLMTMGEKLTQEEVDIIIREADIDGEGFIAYEQFVNIMSPK
ncbi:hypothetical protein Pmani_005779 [Petrolisthes manimaculis]|uniref:Golgi SNAP receptor complex member 1 n=1 Tax=Petrolisthes manimaculis TaxID=1843537 RepID=A0AAE1QEA8_9EUCA|nr:hypothetical protein Pmani_005779 [Petrolisthes manimaculis]